MYIEENFSKILKCKIQWQCNYTLIIHSGNITVHISGDAAQTGVSRFGELRSHWRCDHKPY